MRTLVVYESMFGSTRLVAEAIARGAADAGEAQVLPVSRADAADLTGYDLVVVGGPTHVHGMSRPSSRRGAEQTAAKPGAEETIEPGATKTGVREWLSTLPRVHGRAAAFDTRRHAPALLTGRASNGIGRGLRHHGYDLVAESESFLVDKKSCLEPGEEARAEQWGRVLAGTR